RLRSMELDSEDKYQTGELPSQDSEELNLASLQNGLEQILFEETRHYDSLAPLRSHVVPKLSPDGEDNGGTNRIGFRENLNMLKKAFEEILSREIRKYGVA